MPKDNFDVLKSTECIQCFDRITSRSDAVFKEFEFKSDNAIQSFIGQTSEMFRHLKEESSTYFEAREKKSDEFYEKQESKYDKLETKLTGMVKWTLGIVLFIVTIYGGIIGTVAIQAQDKPNSNEVLSLKDAYTIIQLGDAYRDQRYVIKDGSQVDASTYKWHIGNVFSILNRGGEIKSLPMNQLSKPAPDELKK